MKTLYLFRHGESENNVAELYSGNSETSLTEQGKKQACELANKLPTNLQIIYSSPLSRAIQTAHIAVNNSDLNIPVKELDELHEYDFGDAEGQPFGTFQPRLFTAIANGEIPTAESIGQAYQRAFNVIKFLHTKPFKHIGLAGHKSFSAVLIAAIEGIDELEFVEFRNNFEFENSELKVIKLP